MASPELYPYLIIRLMPAVYQRVLFPPDTDLTALAAQVSHYSKRTKCRCCLAIAEGRSVYCEPDGRVSESAEAPSGGFRLDATVEDWEHMVKKAFGLARNCDYCYRSVLVLWFGPCRMWGLDWMELGLEDDQHSIIFERGAVSELGCSLAERLLAIELGFDVQIDAHYYGYGRRDGVWCPTVTIRCSAVKTPEGERVAWPPKRRAINRYCAALAKINERDWVRWSAFSELA